MNFTIYKDQLNKAINSVINAKPTRTTKPVLEGILIQTNINTIKLTAYDLSIGIEYIVDCDVKEEGTTVINASMLSEFVKKLPNSEISFKTLSENIVEISCEGSNYKLNTMNPIEFPELPNIDVDNCINFEIEQSILKNMIKKTSFAVSTDETRPIYMGALFNIKNNNLDIVALDGYRMAIKKHELEKNVTDLSVIIPGTSLNEIVKILDDSLLPVKFGVKENQAVFQLDNCKIVTRTIEGKFLDYNNTIPSEFNTKVVVNRQQLLDGFERINLVSQSSLEKERQRSVKLNIGVNKMILSCMNQLGEAKEEILLQTEGKELQAGFNTKFFIDVLRVIDEDEIIIEFSSEISPCMIKSVNGGDYHYIILPVRLR